MSDSLKEDISKGESLADKALKAVFDFGASLAPEADFNSRKSTVSRPKEGDAGSSAAVQDSAHKAPGSNEVMDEERKSPFKADDYSGDGKRHLLLACSGSVATIKLPNMLRELLEAHSSELSIRVILTSSATHFLQGQADEQPKLEALASIAGVDSIHRDEDEWDPVWTRGAPILHIELRRWADLLVVAPLSANTLAKIVNGLCDNLLTSVIRAWDTESYMGFAIRSVVDQQASASTNEKQESQAKFGAVETKTTRKRKKIFLAPAMNTAMWKHPITSKHLEVLQDDWYWTKVLLPLEDKQLACGDVGTGAMKEWSSIVKDIEDALYLTKPKKAATSVVAM